jgi:hypothetical protein
MYKPKHRLPWLCRWIGHHRWSCGNDPSCDLSHYCLDCGAVSAYV